MERSDFGRILAVLISPTKTFRSVIERPGWLPPLLVLLLLSSLTISLVGPKIDWHQSIETKLQRSDREVEDPQKLEQFLSILEDHGADSMVIFTLLLPWALYPLLAAIFRFTFRRMGGEISLRTSLSVLLHGCMPWAVGYLLGLPFLVRAESIDLYKPGSMLLNLAAFASDETPLELWVILSSLDLFSIWTLVLLVIGYSLAAKITRARAAMGVVGLWALWITFNVGLAAIG